MSEKSLELFLKRDQRWKSEIKELRTVLKKSKLEETFKWGKPCYSYDGKNIAIIQPFKNFLALMFFKGKHLKDSKKLLVENGPNSRLAARFEFTNVADIKKNSKLIAKYLKEASELEASGKPLKIKKSLDPLPSELKDLFKINAKFKKSFESLTPGRQRGYVLFFNAAKQSETRIRRIEKYRSKIISGKGIND